MLAHIDLEFAAGATPLPIRDAVACAEEPGAAAQIKIANKHTAEMRHMADIVAGARAERQEKLDRGCPDDVDLHRYGDRERNEPDLAVGIDHCMWQLECV